MDPKILELTREDPRYAYEAYEFVCEAVSFTQQRLGRDAPDPDADHHVSGEELARGACDLAADQFGLMAPTVFKLWGVERTDDIGEIVFNLIRADKLSRSDKDDPADFRNLFDLPAALAGGYELTTAAYPGRKGDR